MEFPLRINKYLAKQKISTRRGADTLVEKGMVYINGKKARLGEFVREGDVVEVKGAPAVSYAYYAYYKPQGVITHSPQLGEESIADLVTQKVFPVGRLDKDSHGLILLTNDGRVTDRLLNPVFAHEKEYEVQTKEKIPSNIPALFEKGVQLEDGVRTKPAEAEILDEHTFRLTLTEGKKHQIKRMCAAVRLEVTDLKRVRIETIRLGNLEPNELRQLTGKELGTFLSRIGL